MQTAVAVGATAIASLHVVRWPRRTMLWVPRDLALLRRDLRGVVGLRFAKVLGTGRGLTTATSVDPRRIALFAVWDDPTALDRFEQTHPAMLRWAKADELFAVRLGLIGGHGSWSGVKVLDDLQRGSDEGQIVTLTRAKLPLRSWPGFWKVSRGTSSALIDAPGLVTAIGFGEAPVGLLGTFGLWESAAAVTAFTKSEIHRAALDQSRIAHWFDEELFVRLEPIQIRGSLNDISC